MKKDPRIDLVRELCEAEGISGHERAISRIMKRHVESLVNRIEYDNLGSIIAVKQGLDDQPKIMIAGHMDEIGFLVSRIEEDGYLRLHPIGGWWPHVLLSQRVHVTTREGKQFLGIIGSVPPHGMPAEQRGKVMEMKQLFVDLGIKGKKAVEELGICPGDPVTPIASFEQMADPKYWVGKAFDDRIGVGVVIETLKSLEGVDHPNTVYGVGTVQEEVGLRGARTAAYSVQPDIAFAIDTTLANDVPGAAPGDAKLGAGVAISLADSSVIGHRGLIATLEVIAKEENIPFTFDMLAAGGTDSGEIHKMGRGVINCTLSIPERYVHAHNGMIHETDYDAAIRLLTAFIKRCDRAMLEELRSSKR